MKTILFASFVLFAFFASNVAAEEESTTASDNDDETQQLLLSVKTYVNEKNLKCVDVERECSNARGHIPPIVCRSILKAYLCDNVTTGEGLRHILEQLPVDNDEDESNDSSDSSDSSDTSEPSAPSSSPQ